MNWNFLAYTESAQIGSERSNEVNLATGESDFDRVGGLLRCAVITWKIRRIDMITYKEESKTGKRRIWYIRLQRINSGRSS
jgi:hypothetical protein